MKPCPPKYIMWLKTEKGMIKFAMLKCLTLVQDLPLELRASSSRAFNRAG